MVLDFNLLNQGTALDASRLPEYEPESTANGKVECGRVVRPHAFSGTLEV